LASARRTIRSSSRGSVALISVSGFGVSLTIDEMIEMDVSPEKGPSSGRHLVQDHAEREEIGQRGTEFGRGAVRWIALEGPSIGICSQWSA
jgi:hypothetical protein